MHSLAVLQMERMAATENTEATSWLERVREASAKELGRSIAVSSRCVTTCTAFFATNNGKSAAKAFKLPANTRFV